jgi:quercetin dioxygenase-like cupin family protein
MEAAQIQQDWRQRGFSYTLWSDPPGQVWQNFVHETDELLVLLEGDMELALEGKTLRPHIGEEVLIPAQAQHTVRNIGTTTNRWCFGYKR